MIKFWTISSGAIKGNQYIKIMTKKNWTICAIEENTYDNYEFKTISIGCAINEKTHHDTYYDPQNF
jgi:hypothetical protein